MKYITTLATTLLLLVGCHIPKAKTLRMGDVVQFKFAGRNLFYSEACNNTGVVQDFSEYSDSTRYLIEVRCQLKESRIASQTEFIWVDEEDIVKVIALHQ